MAHQRATRVSALKRSAKNMSFTDTFSEWIHQSIFAHEVSAIRGYAFNLIEDGGDFYIELIGSETFDEVDPDWACDEQFEASPRSIPIPSELHCSDWERCLENMRGVVTKYLAEEFPQAQICLLYTSPSPRDRG